MWHLNEGHSALVSFERIRAILASGGGTFADAVSRASKTSVFTTHTPVPAGNETFDLGLVRTYAEAWGAPKAAGTAPYVDLGSAAAGDGVFNLTVLAIRSSARINGVSKLHGHVADAMC